MTDNSYQFDIPAHQKSIIKVVGIGGGGSNAVNHMFSKGIKDVDFIVVNTDLQALKNSPVPNTLQIGVNLTQGLGAGANPEKGREAALENKEEIRELLGDGTKMVFITAGMGGGTGTGAAPVFAEVARDMDVLTVGIVTAPFRFEGRKKMKQALAGIEELEKYCDTVIVILNDKLKELSGSLPIRQAFAKADEVLSTAAKSIAEIISVHAEINVDFEDVKTVMKDSGGSVMGSAVTQGDARATRAAEEAIASPLLNNNDIHGAQKILLSIMSGSDAELEMDELDDITEYIQARAGEEADIIWGHGIDDSLSDSIRVTVIATGFALELEGAESRRAKDVVASSYAESAAKKKIPELEINPTVSEDEHKIEPVETEDTVEATEPVQPVQSEVETPVIPVNSTPIPPPPPTPIPGPQPPVNDEPVFEFQVTGGDQPAEPENSVLDFGSLDPMENEAEVKPEDITSNISDTGDSSFVGIEDDFVIVDKDTQSEMERRDLMVEQKREELNKRRQERVARLRGLQSSPQEESDSEFKEKMNVPAYIRKEKKLQDLPRSAESQVSRYQLNDDNQILGDNKFLHDNVD
ncbi:hypothetical protein FUAX_22140 [Fulvitalea axinellae]|uniref:Cell division protein FtsZ n=1 Tax=Fulvitalea axinellae TaxID=1182444 RepID=A0AAU9CS36_9BACT|nr:hypothetical protein FUAX_22140 [Fulvitalea axinellae]